MINLKRGCKVQILVADDESTLRLILSEALRKWGYDTVEAENGAEAVS